MVLLTGGSSEVSLILGDSQSSLFLSYRILLGSVSPKGILVWVTFGQILLTFRQIKQTLTFFSRVARE